MKKTSVVLAAMVLAVYVAAPARVCANGWATAGKVLAGVAGADLLFNGANSMVGRTVSGVGSIFTGGRCYAQPAYSGYYYTEAPRTRCWEEIRRVPAYDAYGNFLGYFDRRVTVCPQ